MIEVLVFLIIIGVCLYLVELIPMDATVKRIIQVLAILIIVLYVLEAFGFWHGFHHVKIG